MFKASNVITLLALVALITLSACDDAATKAAVSKSGEGETNGNQNDGQAGDDAQNSPNENGKEDEQNDKDDSGEDDSKNDDVSEDGKDDSADDDSKDDDVADDDASEDGKDDSADDDPKDDDVADDDVTDEEEVVAIVILSTLSETEIETLESSLSAYEEANSVSISYETTDDLESELATRIAEGNAPDLVLFNNSFTFQKYAEAGTLLELDSQTANALSDNYSSAWVELVTCGGAQYGVVHNASIDSLIFYPQKGWASKGWITPSNWSELKTACESMVKKGETPFAVGVEDGSASGWIGTDWVEDIMLGAYGPSQYENWASGELLFDSSELNFVFESLGDIWFTKGYVYGGVSYITVASVDSTKAILFETPSTPKAWMLRQGSEAIANFDASLIDDAEIGVFLFPSIEASWGKCATGSMSIYSLVTDSDEGHALLTYMTSSASTTALASTGVLFPHKDQDLNIYPNYLYRDVATIMMNIDHVKSDASEYMPQEIEDAFHLELGEYTKGKDIDKVLSAIDVAW